MHVIEEETSCLVQDHTTYDEEKCSVLTACRVQLSADASRSVNVSCVSQGFMLQRVRDLRGCTHSVALKRRRT